MTDLIANETLPGDTWLAERLDPPRWTVAEWSGQARPNNLRLLPALNEQDTIASVIETISPMLGGLVDELIVLDSAHPTRPRSGRLPPVRVW